jgi:hypothetical protein
MERASLKQASSWLHCDMSIPKILTFTHVYYSKQPPEQAANFLLLEVRLGGLPPVGTIFGLWEVHAEAPIELV